jgi:hypothetical protein
MSRKKRFGAFTDTTIAGVPDAYWEGLPAIHQSHTSNLVYEDPKYRVFVSRMTPEDYGFGDWQSQSENSKALKMWHEERIAVEKKVKGRGYVLLPRHRRTIHMGTR